ncbi:MAG: hypothetical protein H9W81_13400, partial [Enterococcus sp.]|nr:hypothetical protein [Enterococcus sp.]
PDTTYLENVSLAKRILFALATAREGMEPLPRVDSAVILDPAPAVMAHRRISAAMEKDTGVLRAYIVPILEYRKDYVMHTFDTEIPLPQKAQSTSTTEEVIQMVLESKPSLSIQDIYAYRFAPSENNDRSTVVVRYAVNTAQDDFSPVSYGVSFPR